MSRLLTASPVQNKTLSRGFQDQLSMAISE
jgi:hypothetical protein